MRKKQNKPVEMDSDNSFSDTEIFNDNNLWQS
jgi:hypothetical protein